MRYSNIKQLECVFDIYSCALGKSDNQIIKNLLLNCSLNLTKNLLNEIFLFYLNNDTLLSINSYYRYYNNKELINWIVNLSNIEFDYNNKKILDGNVKVNSFLECIYDKCGIIDIVGICNNNIINKLCELNINEFYNDKFKLLDYDILTTEIDNYDYIFLDFLTGIHNMTHAACCSKIKNLKIRGTKVDSLLLQLIMTSLNENGKALLIVPDSIFYGDSMQQVLTRKYLLENFNIKNIIQLDENFYKIKPTKNSILYFTNTGKTSEVVFSKLSSDLVLENIINIDYDKIVSRNYSLFYKHYIEKLTLDLKYNSILDYCKIYNDIDNVKLNNVISLDKYYKDNTSINLELDNKSEIFIDCPSLYVAHYIYTLINTNINLYTSGKLLKFNIEKINTITIPDLSENQQNTINNFISISNNIILQNNNKIEMYKKLQYCLLNSLPNPTILLLDIVSITNTFEDNLIGLIKNGLTAGTVYNNYTNKLNTNSYYLKLVDMNYDLKFIYYYLKYLEPHIKEQCELTKQPLLTMGIITRTLIPSININIQNDIVIQCVEFENNINQYINDNLNIKNKNIINMILKLY
jgi:hypothetical protein